MCIHRQGIGVDGTITMQEAAKRGNNFRFFAKPFLCPIFMQKLFENLLNFDTFNFFVFLNKNFLISSKFESF